MGGPYFILSVWATDMLAEIWVGDEEGNFVCKDIGWLREGLEAGTYVVQIGSLKAPKHHIKLEGNLHITEDQLRARPMTERRFFQRGAELLGITWPAVVLGIICLLLVKDVWSAEATCATFIDPVTCVANKVKVGVDYGVVVEALGKPVAAFEAASCPPEATPGDSRCITKQVTVHIIVELEFLVAYSAGVVETVDYRPLPNSHRDLLDHPENPFK